MAQKFLIKGRIFEGNDVRLKNGKYRTSFGTYLQEEVVEFDFGLDIPKILTMGESYATLRPASEPEFGEWQCDAEVKEILPFPNCYKHQDQGQRILYGGDNLLALTRTSSGKTMMVLPYVLERALDGKRTIYIMPRIALIKDQVATIKKAASQLGLRVTEAHGQCDQSDYTGDIVVCTAFSLNYYLAKYVRKNDPFHQLVVDESHFNGGAQGALVAGVIRRLIGVTKHNHDIDMQVAMLSATVGDPRALSEKLTGMPGASFKPVNDSFEKRGNRVDITQIVPGKRTEGVVIETIQMAHELGHKVLLVWDNKNKLMEVQRELDEINIPMVLYHADMSSEEQDMALDHFVTKGGVCGATNCVEAGVDFPDLPFMVTVANADTTQLSVQQRRGRAGRAGSEGISLCLVPAMLNMSAEEHHNRPIEVIYPSIMNPDVATLMAQLYHLDRGKPLEEECDIQELFPECEPEDMLPPEEAPLEVARSKPLFIQERTIKVFDRAGDKGKPIGIMNQSKLFSFATPKSRVWIKEYGKTSRKLMDLDIAADGTILGKPAKGRRQCEGKPSIIWSVAEDMEVPAGGGKIYHDLNSFYSETEVYDPIAGGKVGYAVKPCIARKETLPMYIFPQIEPGVKGVGAAVRSLAVAIATHYGAPRSDIMGLITAQRLPLLADRHPMGDLTSRFADNRKMLLNSALKRIHNCPCEGQGCMRCVGGRVGEMDDVEDILKNWMRA